MEPSAFAAQLISRLEKLKREQDTMSSLEERLQQIQEVRTPPSHYIGTSHLTCNELWNVPLQPSLGDSPVLNPVFAT